MGPANRKWSWSLNAQRTSWGVGARPEEPPQPQPRRRPTCTTMCCVASAPGCTSAASSASAPARTPASTSRVRRDSQKLQPSCAHAAAHCSAGASRVSASSAPSACRSSALPRYPPPWRPASWRPTCSSGGGGGGGELGLGRARVLRSKPAQLRCLACTAKQPARRSQQPRAAGPANPLPWRSAAPGSPAARPPEGPAGAPAPAAAALPAARRLWRTAPPPRPACSCKAGPRRPAGRTARAAAAPAAGCEPAGAARGRGWGVVRQLRGWARSSGIRAAQRGAGPGGWNPTTWHASPGGRSLAAADASAASSCSACSRWHAAAA